MKQKLILYLVFLTLMIQSCAPLVRTNLDNKLEVFPMEENTKVFIIHNADSIPDQSKLVGDIDIDDAGFTTNCKRKAIIQLAKKEARKVGANIIYLTEIRTPNIWSTCYRIKGLLYRNEADKFTYLNAVEQVEKVIEKRKEKKPFKKENIFFDGDIRLKLALPYFNALSLKPKNELTSFKTGFIGESIGLEYSYKPDRFIESNFSLVLTHFHPIPIQQYEVEVEYQNSYYFSLTNNHVFKEQTFGYGLNYSVNYKGVGLTSLSDSIPSYNRGHQSTSIGFTLNTYKRVWRHLNIGVIYRPTFFRIKPKNEFNLEHLFSIEFMWRIRLRRNKKYKY